MMSFLCARHVIRLHSCKNHGWKKLMKSSGFVQGQCHYDQCHRPKLCSSYVDPSPDINQDKNEQQFLKIMRKVPAPVVVVTTALHTPQEPIVKRGVTCSSFTSISLHPPVISFCIKRPSRMHQLLLRTEKFAVHVLSSQQVGCGIHFSKPPEDKQDQFENIPHYQNTEGVPIIEGACAVLECKPHLVNRVGDHNVWYGEVVNTHMQDNAPEPLLYYARKFRSIGDETFMQAFEDRTLPFEEWTHEAHLRMAWNYIREHGLDHSIPYIKNGIKRYNERNKAKISRGYHETVTMFYIYQVAHAIHCFDHPDITFEEFIVENSYLQDKDLLWKHYSKEAINSKEASNQFVEPDQLALPIKL